MNKIILVGRLTKDIDIRRTQTDKSIGRFTIATDRGVKGQDGKYLSDFIDCEAWESTAEYLSKYSMKGGRVAVEGSIRNDSYKDQNGNSKYRTYVLVNKAEVLDFKKSVGDTEHHDPYKDFGEKVDNWEPPF